MGVRGYREGRETHLGGAQGMMMTQGASASRSKKERFPKRKNIVQVPWSIFFE